MRQSESVKITDEAFAVWEGLPDTVKFDQYFSAFRDEFQRIHGKVNNKISIFCLKDITVIAFVNK